MQRLLPHEIDELLSKISALALPQADDLLDLREILLKGGHPGKCVRCFFAISESVRDKETDPISVLRTLLERRIELTVSAGSAILETIPFRPDHGVDLESYCRRTIQRIRMDRAYSHRSITIRFQYREAA